MLKLLTVGITTGKFWNTWEYQTTLPASCKTCMPVKKQQLEPDTEWWTDSKLEKEYTKAVYCHPAYLTLTSMQSTSCKMPAYSNEAQAEIKIATRNIKNLRYTDNTILMAES